MRINENEKMAFITPFGKYEFRTMPSGLKVAPSTRLMDCALDGLKEYTAFYLDDVVIFSEVWSMHLQNLTWVLRLLRETGLKVN